MASIVDLEDLIQQISLLHDDLCETVSAKNSNSVTCNFEFSDELALQYDILSSDHMIFTSVNCELVANCEELQSQASSLLSHSKDLLNCLQLEDKLHDVEDYVAQNYFLESCELLKSVSSSLAEFSASNDLIISNACNQLQIEHQRISGQYLIKVQSVITKSIIISPGAIFVYKNITRFVKSPLLLHNLWECFHDINQNSSCFHQYTELLSKSLSESLIKPIILRKFLFPPQVRQNKDIFEFRYDIKSSVSGRSPSIQPVIFEIMNSVFPPKFAEFQTSKILLTSQVKKSNLAPEVAIFQTDYDELVAVSEDDEEVRISKLLHKLQSNCNNPNKFTIFRLLVPFLHLSSYRNIVIYFNDVSYLHHCVEVAVEAPLLLESSLVLINAIQHHNSTQARLVLCPSSASFRYLLRLMFISPISNMLHDLTFSPLNSNFNYSLHEAGLKLLECARGCDVSELPAQYIAVKRFLEACENGIESVVKVILSGRMKSLPPREIVCLLRKFTVDCTRRRDLEAMLVHV